MIADPTRRIVEDPNAMAADCAGRIAAWAALMAARGCRVNALRLWKMQGAMPALTLYTGLLLRAKPGAAS